jgi:hypothetical protein
MRPPILCFEDYDLMVFETPASAEAWVEPPDVGVLRSYDADGQRLRFEADEHTVHLRETDDRDPEGLRLALLATFRAAGVAEAGERPLDELVAVAAQQFAVG